MKTKPLRFFALIFSVVLALYPAQTRANTIALDFSGGIEGSGGANTTLGWAFSLSSSVLVTDLGIFDGPRSTAGDGLADSHLISIWTSGGTLVTSTTVPAGTSGTLPRRLSLHFHSPDTFARGRLCDWRTLSN